jgi:hypothetical protein
MRTAVFILPIAVAARSKAWVCGRSLAGIMGSNPARGHGWLSLVSVCALSGRGLCNQLIIRSDESYRVWRVYLCDLETSTMSRPRPELDCCVTGKEITSSYDGLFLLHDIYIYNTEVKLHL